MREVRFPTGHHRYRMRCESIGRDGGGSGVLDVTASALNLKPPIHGFEPVFNDFPQHGHERPLGAGRGAIHV